jgi:hypothetical protein
VWLATADVLISKLNPTDTGLVHSPSLGGTHMDNGG